MKPTEILSDIKSLLGIELSEETKIQLAAEKLANGTEIQAEKFESGEAVFIETEDESVPLPQGEYELESGKILVVVDEGVIDTIKDPESKEETEDVAEEVEASEEEEKEEEKMEYVSKQEFSEAIDEIKAMIDGLTPKEKEEEMSETKEVIETEMAAQPIVHNVEKEVEKFQFAYQNNVRQDRNARIKSILNNL